MRIPRLSALIAAAAGFLASGTARAESAPADAELDVSAKLDVSALAASSDALYVGSFDRGLYVLEHRRTLRPVNDAALSPHVNALAWSERDRVLWVATARGLTRCARGNDCARLGPQSAVHAVVVSATGVVIAGGDAGLLFVEGDRVRTYGKKEGAPFRSVWALAEANGRLFAGTTSGLFWGAPIAFAGRHAALGRAAIVLGTLPDDWVTALSYGGDALFAGTYSAGIVVFRDGPTGLVSTDRDTSLGYVNPAGVAELGDGSVAVATMDGLRLGPPNRTTLVATRARDVTAFVPDPSGGFWIGTRAGIEFWKGPA